MVLKKDTDRLASRADVRLWKEFEATIGGNLDPVTLTLALNELMKQAGEELLVVRANHSSDVDETPAGVRLKNLRLRILSYKHANGLTSL